MNVTNGEIANLMCEIRRNKKRTQELRGELLRVAVEELGVEQEHAKKMNLEVFVDGFLIGRGMQQSWRDIGGGDQ